MKFEVIVTRVGYAHRTLVIEAGSQAEAVHTAEEICGNFDYNEHSAEYEVEQHPRRLSCAS